MFFILVVAVFGTAVALNVNKVLSGSSSKVQNELVLANMEALALIESFDVKNTSLYCSSNDDFICMAKCVKCKGEFFAICETGYYHGLALGMNGKCPNDGCDHIFHYEVEE